MTNHLTKIYKNIMNELLEYSNEYKDDIFNNRIQSYIIYEGEILNFVKMVCIYKNRNKRFG